MKRPQSNLVLTSIFMQPEAYTRFKEIAVAEGTTGAALIRGFILQTVRRVEKTAQK